VILSTVGTDEPENRKVPFPAIAVARRASPVDYPGMRLADNMTPYGLGACGLARGGVEGGWDLLVYTGNSPRRWILPARRWPRHQLGWALAPGCLVEFTGLARDNQALPLHATVYDLEGTKAASRALSEITPADGRWLAWVGTTGEDKIVFRTSLTGSRSATLVYSLPALSLVSSWELSPRPAAPETMYETGVVLGTSGVMCEVVGEGLWWKMPADNIPHRITFNFREVIGGRILWSHEEDVTVVKYPKRGE